VVLLRFLDSLLLVLSNLILFSRMVKCGLVSRFIRGVVMVVGMCGDGDVWYCRGCVV